MSRIDVHAPNCRRGSSAGKARCLGVGNPFKAFTKRPENALSKCVGSRIFVLQRTGKSLLISITEIPSLDKIGRKSDVLEINTRSLEIQVSVSGSHFGMMSLSDKDYGSQISAWREKVKPAVAGEIQGSPISLLDKALKQIEDFVTA